MNDIVWFADVDKKDVGLVGGKGANLGELQKIGVQVPGGFIITAQAYFTNLKAFGTFQRLKGILFDLDVENPVSLDNKAHACQEEIKKNGLDKKLETAIYRSYEKLSNDRDILVAVRSSATAEDLPQASFAGQQSTFLNIKGAKNLKQAIIDCWASLFEARAIFYRQKLKFDHFKVGIAVVVQKMIQSETAGVMFTQDPVTGTKNTIVIEAGFGLGELVVSGKITPDHYEVDKKNLAIIKKNVISQQKMLVGKDKGNKMITISKAFTKKQKLPDGKIVELAKIGRAIEKHYFFPQDIEWAYQGGKIYIVQTRPVTTMGKSKSQIVNRKNENLHLPLTVHNSPLLTGAPASPQIATGRVVIIKSPKELSRVLRGDVLVTQMTNPDYVPAMRRAAAIITDRGGRTSHAAIVARELGIACVVGTGNATRKLKDGMIITVDGAHGLIFKGNAKTTKKDLHLPSAPSPKIIPKTATKLYVNLAESELAPKIAAQNVDGVGLLRAEFILAQIGIHPKEFIAQKKQGEFIERLASSLTVFGKAFGSRPVIYRATDFKTNEYRNLKGGDKFEPKESNPMLGFRGAFRYIKNPDVFALELLAIKKVRQRHKNLHLMIPFVRTVGELMQVKDQVSQVELFDDPHFKFWMMAEIPANVILLEEFLKVGVDGISIGSNDLTMLILGTDRDNEEVASQFYELDPAVLWALERVVKTCVKNQIACSICGQAPSQYPDLTQKLVSWGITSISVNPDAIDSTREIIYEAEKKLVEHG